LNPIIIPFVFPVVKLSADRRQNSEQILLGLVTILLKEIHRYRLFVFLDDEQRIDRKNVEKFKSLVSGKQTRNVMRIVKLQYP